MIPPRTILAATDFSDSSTAALVFAARLARHCQAALHVVHAEDPLLAAAAEHSGIDLAAQTREELQHAIATAPPAPDCSPRLHAVAGPAVDVILDVARAQRADLVVVGSRGMSGAERLVFGSTTEGCSADPMYPCWSCLRDGCHPGRPGWTWPAPDLSSPAWT